MIEASAVQITVRLFAMARAVADNDSVQLNLPPHATISDLRAALIARLPELAPLAGALRFAVNEDYASDDTPVHPSDELACIPPVSGG